MEIEMSRLETLIDNLLTYLPPDIPFLLSLTQQPEGRYIFLGLAAVIALLAVWTLLALLRAIFFGQKPQKPNNDKKPPIELSKHIEPENGAETETTDGFSFYRKAQDAKAGRLDEDPQLVAIEQEMLALRSLYTGGQILKEVYVSETRRLYAEAQVIKDNQCK